jgi:ATP-dependent Clp protease ATP-binding subunit ClpC
VLQKLGADLNRVRQQVIQLLSGYQGKEAQTAGTAPEAAPSSSLVLDQFGRNYTQAAKEGKLDPVIGREKEIERVMQSSSVSPVSARPRASRAWPSRSCAATSPRR